MIPVYADEFMMRRVMQGGAHGAKRSKSETVREEYGVYPSLAMVYSPVQEWRETYELQTALKRGTLFKELDKPFSAADGAKGETIWK